MRLLIFLAFNLLILSIQGFKFSEIFSKTQKRSDSLKDDQCSNATHYEYHQHSHWSKIRYFNESCEQIEKDWIPGCAALEVRDQEWFWLTIRQINFTCFDSNMKSSFFLPGAVLTEGGSGVVGLAYNYRVYLNEQPFQKTGWGYMAPINSKEMPYTFDIETPEYQYVELAYPSMQELKVYSIYPDPGTEPLNETQKQILFQYVANQLPYKSLKLCVRSNFGFIVEWYLKRLIPNSHNSSQNESSVNLPHIPFEVNFTRINTDYTYDKNANYYSYRIKFTNTVENKCGPSVPLKPLNTMIYGGAQEFLSFTFVNNFVSLLMQNKTLDTILNRETWTNRNFKFTAGQLAQIFAGVSDKFSLYDEAKGACNATQWQQIVVKKASNTTFNVSFATKCYLNISKTKIVEFNVSLQLEISGIPQRNQMGLELKSFDAVTTFDDSFGFKLQDKTKADQAIRDCLETLYDEQLIGSGWPLYIQRVAPRFLVLEESFLVYDNVRA